MENIIDIFLHLDVHLNQWIAWLGPWIYLFLFAIIFCETGLVVMPFLPGDSLLFALGALTATEGSILRLPVLGSLLVGAAILGDAVNYAIGKKLGPRVFRESGWWLKKEHLLATEAFYERHGGKTIIMARFIPIVRTFAPFVAGVGRMRYSRFGAYNVAGAFLWVLSLLLAGYFFGNIPVVKNHFEFVVLGIIAVSLMPLAIRMMRNICASTDP